MMKLVIGLVLSLCLISVGEYQPPFAFKGRIEQVVIEVK